MTCLPPIFVSSRPARFNLNMQADTIPHCPSPHSDRRNPSDSTAMESDDLPLIDIGGEDDALLRNLPQDDAGGSFACTPLAVARSVGPSRPPKSTMSKSKLQFGETGRLLRDVNKENLQFSNSVLGSSNLNLEPQRMKKSRKAGAYNLRKSLAWDKAFFTEEGVLSSTELSMICGTPSKLFGEELSTVCEEEVPPTYTNAIPQTVDSKLSRKLPPSGLKSNKKTWENSLMKQKPVASSSLKPKRLSAAPSAKKSERKEGSCSNSLASTSHKRLMTTSPAKPAAQKSKISKIQGSKPDPCMTTAATNNLDASYLNRARPAPSIQKRLVPKVLSNTSTSGAPKIVAQRTHRPAKSSDQRIRKNKSDLNAREKPSARYQAPRVKEVNSSETKPDRKILSGPKVEIRSSKPAVPVHANSDSTNNVEYSVQLQAARPSGLRMPSPSLRFFSEPKQSVSSTAAQSNARPSNLLHPVIPFSHIEGAAGHYTEPKIHEVTPSKVPSLGSVWQCSVTSVKSPEISCQSEQHRKNELSISECAPLHEKFVDQGVDGIPADAGKHFLEHEQTSLSNEGVGRKDDRSASQNRLCERNDRDMLQVSQIRLKPLVEMQVEDASGKNSDSYLKDGQCNLSVSNEVCCQGSAVEDLADICGLESGQEPDDSIIGHREAHDLQVPFPVINEVPHVHDGLSLNVELLKGALSPEKGSKIDVINVVMDADEVAKTPVGEETFSASIMEIVNTVTKQQEVPHLPVPMMDQLAFGAARSSLDGDDCNEDDRYDASAIEATLPTSFPDTKPQAGESTDLSTGEHFNVERVGQNSQFEPQISPKACKGPIDEVNHDDKLSFFPAGEPILDTARSSTKVSNQQYNISDELVTDALMPYGATLGSLSTDPCSKDLVNCEGGMLNNQPKFYLSSSTDSVKPLMTNEVELGSRNEHEFGDLVIDHDEGLISVAEFHLNPDTSRVQIEDTVGSAGQGLALENETVPVFLEKDIYCTDSVGNECREPARCNHTEIIFSPINHGNQTADAPTININEAFLSPHVNQTASWPPSDPDLYHSSPPHGSSDAYILLEASRDAATEVGPQENDDQMEQEPPNHSLDTNQQKEYPSLSIDSRSYKRSHDQTTGGELPLSPKKSEDCSRSPVAICGFIASSPSEESNSIIRNVSNKYEGENHHGVHRNIDNEDTETNTASHCKKKPKDGENQSQLVIRPPKGVVPFSDEWLAALEAAGEDILTLKTGRVQNSPPSRSSPEPSPWSPVKKKATQAIGPYDCTKFTSGQH